MTATILSPARPFGRWIEASRSPHELTLGMTLQEAHVHALLAGAAEQYRQALATAPSAQAYLIGRTVSPATARRFGIGYARRAWRDLWPLLHGFRQNEVDASGLVARAAGVRVEGGFDRFRDRLMFPIRGRDGRVAGFGARTLSEQGGQAKYINSPEGPCFKKRELVYGLYEAQEAIRARGHAVVMEGYLDVVLSHQAGLETAVGSLGTAVTAHQVEQLLQLAPRLLFCFDGDPAGYRAGERAMKMLAPLLCAGRTFEFVVLPAGEDPASLVQKGRFGVEALQDAVRVPASFEVFATQWALEGCELAIAEGRSRCVARLGEIWGLMPPSATRAKIAAIGASLLGMSEEVVLGLWASSVRHAAGAQGDLP